MAQKDPEKRKAYNKAYGKKYYAKNKGKMKDQHHRFYQDNKPVFKERALRRNYNLTLAQHKQMYFEQDGCCLLCGQPVEYSKVHTDHDHKTGKVRGLLCARCNLCMGFVDDLSFIEKAIAYKESFRG